VLADHPGDLLHWRDARTHDIGAPLPEHGGDDIDLLAVEDGAQMFAIDPGAGGAFAGGLGDQGIKVGPACSGQSVAVLKQRPAQSLEAGIGALFETPGLVEGGGGMGDEVKFVEGDAGLGRWSATKIGSIALLSAVNSFDPMLISYQDRALVAPDTRILPLARPRISTGNT